MLPVTFVFRVTQKDTGQWPLWVKKAPKYFAR